MRLRRQKGDAGGADRTDGLTEPSVFGDRMHDMPGSSAQETILEVRKLSVAYVTGSGLVMAVDRVDLDLGRGEFLGVVGESGCGKSTLLFGIAQLLSPPARIVGGSVKFRGKEIAGLSDKQLRHIRWREYSVVMQSAMNALNPVMTVAAQMRDRSIAKIDGVDALRQQSKGIGEVHILCVGIEPQHSLHLTSAESQPRLRTVVERRPIQ